MNKAWYWLLIGFVVIGNAGTATMTASSNPRQVYKGFGFSLLNTERYSDLSRAQQQEISQAVIQGTGANLLRLWHNSNWVNSYIHTNYLPDAIAAGIDTILMAPGGNPSQIASEILTVKNAGYNVHYTALYNEPDKNQGWDPASNLTQFKLLHNELNSRGLTTKQICCDDANVDGDAKDRIDAILNDGNAKAWLAATSTHSYGMAAEPDYAKRPFNNGKDWWMTEHSAEGASYPTDYAKASRTSSTMLNDLNQGVTHWIYFIGYGISNTNLPNVHNNVFLAYYDGNSFNKPVGSGWFTFSTQYHYIRQINQAFSYGTRFRYVTASGLKSNDMLWTYLNRSTLNAAIGVRPDGKWAIGISNTDNSSAWDGGSSFEDWTVNLDITELHGTGSRKFNLVRSGPTTGFLKPETDVTLVDGKSSITVRKNELVTLVSMDTSPILGADTLRLSGNGILEAELATQLSGFQIEAQHLGFAVDQSYAKYKNLDLRSDFNRVAIRYAVPSTYAGNTIELRWDSPSGALAGSLVAKATASWTDFRVDTISITGANQVRDLYLVVKVTLAGVPHIANVDRFQFLHSQQNPVLIQKRTTSSIQNRKLRHYLLNGRRIN